MCWMVDHHDYHSNIMFANSFWIHCHKPCSIINSTKKIRAFFFVFLRFSMFFHVLSLFITILFRVLSSLC